MARIPKLPYHTFLWLRTIHTPPHLGFVQANAANSAPYPPCSPDQQHVWSNHTTQPNAPHPLPHPNQNQRRRVSFAATLTPFQCVQSALATTNIVSSSAPKKPHGIGSIKPLLLRQENHSSCTVATPNKSVQNGNEMEAVTANTPICMFVQGVGRTLTELLAALELRKQEPLTPYRHKAWEASLSHFGLLQHFAKVPAGLHTGFILNFPLISQTQAPPNRPSIIMHIHSFKQSVNIEIAKGWYIGPFPLSMIESTLGAYQSSPLSIIPKPGRPGKFCLIQNFSFPLSPSPDYPNPSINSQIQAVDFPTAWGKFSVIYLLLSHLPPGSEAATQDVAEAYCTVPLHPSQWAAAGVRISEMLGWIDTCTAFGATPSAGAYGHMSDAGCEIMRHEGIGLLDKWVDDHLFF